MNKVENINVPEKQIKIPIIYLHKNSSFRIKVQNIKIEYTIRSLCRPSTKINEVNNKVTIKATLVFMEALLTCFSKYIAANKSAQTLVSESPQAKSGYGATSDIAKMALI